MGDTRENKPAQTTTAAPAADNDAAGGLTPLQMRVLAKRARDKKAASLRSSETNYTHAVHFLADFENMVAAWKTPAPPDADAQLLPAQAAQLEQLHQAFLQLKTKPDAALKLWEQIKSDVQHAVTQATTAQQQMLKLMPENDPNRANVTDNAEIITSAAQSLSYADKLFVGGAYYADKNEAKQTDGLERPDDEKAAEEVVAKKKELADATELLKQARETSVALGKQVRKPLSDEGGEGIEKVNEVYELVMAYSDAKELLEKARERGLVQTMADLNKLLDKSTSILLKTVGEVGEGITEALREAKLAKLGGKAATGAVKEDLEHLEKLSTKFKSIAKLGKMIGTAAAIASAVADGIATFSALRKGDYAEAASHAVDAAADLAPLALGSSEAGFAGPLAVGVVVIKAEIAAFSMAADIIRNCKRGMVRDAASAFVEGATKIANDWGESFVADCTLLTDESKAPLHAEAMKQAKVEAQQVLQGFTALYSQILAKQDPMSIGGTMDVVQSLGPEALAALSQPWAGEANILILADNVKAVFHGTNLMAKYVSVKYAPVGD